MNVTIIARISLAFVLAAGLLLSQAQAADQQESTAPLFLSLTSVDPHAAHMALSVAEMAAQKGHPVTVFLNLDAVRIAHKDAAMFTPARADLERAMKAGVKVLACIHCLGYAGMKAEDLIGAIPTSTPELLMGALFAKDARVLSY
jgi:predicted peroxiredoxin